MGRKDGGGGRFCSCVEATNTSQQRLRPDSLSVNVGRTEEVRNEGGTEGKRGGRKGGKEWGRGEGGFPCEDIVSVHVWRPRIQAELRQRRDSLSVNVGRMEEVRKGGRRERGEGGK